MLFGSMKHMAVRTPSGRTGYTSRRRADAIRDMGYQVDGDGFIVGYQVNPNTGMIAGTNQRPGQAPAAAGGPSGGWNPMQAFQQGLGGLLGMQSAFARPEAAAALAGMFGQSAPGWAGGGNPGVFSMGGYVPSGPIKPQMSTPLQMGEGTLMDRLRQILGTTAVSGGSRGPSPQPFNYLRRFSGPFGNGGGPIAPVPGMNTAAY